MYAIYVFLNYSNKLTNLNKIYTRILIRYFYGYIISELHSVKKGQRLIRSDELARIALPTHADWLIISDLPFKRASRKRGIKIDPNILYKKLNHIYKNPDKHIDIIKQILDLQTD